MRAPIYLRVLHSQFLSKTLFCFDFVKWKFSSCFKIICIFHSFRFCVAVSLSFLLFHPRFPYLAIMELGGKGEGGKNKEWQLWPILCFYSHRGEMKNALLLQFWKIPLGGNKKRETEIVQFTFRSKAAPVSTSVQLWVCSPHACSRLLQSVCLSLLPAACQPPAKTESRRPRRLTFQRAPLARRHGVQILPT